MYLEYFGLSENPFRMTPDPRFLYLSPAHSRAMAYMEYTLWNRDSFVLITGEIGSGKTTLIQNLLSELDANNVTVANIYQTQLDPTEFLQALLVEFGFKPYRAKKVELLNTLNQFLDEQHRKGKQVVVIVDEAQNLNREVLEEIRMLASLEVHKQRMMNVVLCGQPELNDLLEREHLEQLSQRIRLRFHIRALGDDEILPYIQHRLKVAGAANPDLFAESLVPFINQYTGGVPRLINTLCDTALLGASIDEEKEINLERLESAIDELSWVPYAERRIQQRAAKTDDAAQSQLVSRRPRVIVKLDNLLLGEYTLDKPYMVIGRVHTSDIRLEGTRVSSVHAMLYTTDKDCYLFDTHSTNGTFVNGKRVVRHKLKHGDTFEVTKKYVFKYLEHHEDKEELEAANDTLSGIEHVTEFPVKKVVSE